MPRVLVAGCGFVGLATARLFLEKGWEVAGLTHSEESAAKLAGEKFRVIACDIAERAAVESRVELRGLDAVVHCASSGRGGAEEYRRVYFEGARNLIEVLAPKTLIFTSSTSVYAQTDGSWVDEDCAAEPPRETGRVLRETEELVRVSGGIVARLAAIYGPNRSVLLRKFFDGTAVLEGDGAKWINQVHRDDAASALVALVSSGARGIFNVCDDEPLEQRRIYEWLARRFARPMPPNAPIDFNRKRGWTNKRVSNAKLRALGWTPRFSRFLEAVESDGTIPEP